MELQQIKNGMMDLWKNIFHDSPEYISLIFDNYFDKSRYVYKEEGGKIIASILGIPYNFKAGSKKMTGLYLCGIATDVGYRRKGIMSELLKKIEEENKGEYDFTFLIPSGETNRNIYESKGYHNAIYKIHENYTSAHDFEAEFISTLFNFDEHSRRLKQQLFESIKVSRFSKAENPPEERIIEFIKNYEGESKQYLHLIHSIDDLKIAVEENKIRRGEIFYAENKAGELSAVMFTASDYNGRIIIYSQYCNDPCTYFKLLDTIKRTYAEMSLTVLRFPEDVKGASIWSETSIVPNPEGQTLESLVGVETRVYYSSDHSKPYGMIKVFNLDKFIDLLANLRKDCSFKVYVRNQSSRATKCIEVKNGSVKVTDYTEEETSVLRRTKGITVISLQDLFDIMFRKKKQEDIIMEAFSIPRLPINISLMLD